MVLEMLILCYFIFTLTCCIILGHHNEIIETLSFIISLHRFLFVHDGFLIRPHSAGVRGSGLILQLFKILLQWFKWIIFWIVCQEVNLGLLMLKVKDIKYCITIQYLIHVIHKNAIWRCQLGVSPPANIMTFRPGLTYFTFNLDPRDLWP